jgi:hypothetical protein
MPPHWILTPYSFPSRAQWTTDTRTEQATHVEETAANSQNPTFEHSAVQFSTGSTSHESASTATDPSRCAPAAATNHGAGPLDVPMSKIDPSHEPASNLMQPESAPLQAQCALTEESVQPAPVSTDQVTVPEIHHARSQGSASDSTQTESTACAVSADTASVDAAFAQHTSSTHTASSVEVAIVP